MHVDTGRVRQRADHVRTQLTVLRSIATSTDADGFARDRMAAAATRYLLQTCIEALIDIAYHLSAKLAQHAPKTAHDAFDTMVKLRILDEDTLPRHHEMLRFRNRVVHGYLDVEDRRIHAMISGPELDEIATTLARFESAALRPPAGGPANAGATPPPRTDRLSGPNAGPGTGGPD